MPFSKNKLTKNKLNQFFTKTILKENLYENTEEFDAIIVILSAHGTENGELVASDGKCLSLKRIRGFFDNEALVSFTGKPKIFIIDACRGENDSTFRVTNTPHASPLSSSLRQRTPSLFFRITKHRFQVGPLRVNEFRNGNAMITNLSLYTRQRKGKQCPIGVICLNILKK